MVQPLEKQFGGQAIPFLGMYPSVAVTLALGCQEASGKMFAATLLRKDKNWK